PLLGRVLHGDRVTYVVPFRLRKTACRVCFSVLRSAEKQNYCSRLQRLFTRCASSIPPQRRARTRYRPRRTKRDSRRGQKRNLGGRGNSVYHAFSLYQLRENFSSSRGESYKIPPRLQKRCAGERAPTRARYPA